MVLGRDNGGKFPAIARDTGLPDLGEARRLLVEKMATAKTTPRPSSVASPTGRMKAVCGSANCVACHRLWKDNAALLLEYNAALVALAATSRSDRPYADRWTDLSNVSERLNEAQRLQRLHQGRHHSH
jgi:hypothetical protein